MTQTSLPTALRQLLALGRPHFRLLGLAFVGMAVVGLTTGLYAWLMGPVLRFLLTGGAEGLEIVTRFAPEVRSWPHQRVLYGLPALVVAIGAVKGVAYLAQFYFVGLFGQRVVMDLRRRVFEKILTLSPMQRSQSISGDLLSRFTADVAAVEQAATYTVASWLRDSLQVVILVGVAVWWSWQLALIALVAVPVAVWPASRVTRALLGRTREGQGALGGLAGQVQEGLGALRTIQAFEARSVEADRMAQRTAIVQVALTRAGWSRAAVPGIMELLAATAIAGSMSWAISTRAVSSEALISFLGAVILLYQPAKDLGRVTQFLVTATAAMERLNQLLAMPVSVTQPPGAVVVPPLKQAISVEGVHFSWGNRVALDGATLTIPVGEVTALVGESGSGKSTLTSLLLGFERPSAGVIRLDGVDAATATLESVRAQFALVTQDALVFSAAARDNLLLGRAGSDESLGAAARVARADEFLLALPQGYDTVIGERGVTLSGGQKQRLCLARAVLAGAPVLVLDEATSNLDAENERLVQEALDQVLAGRTALVIAHRLSSVRRADSIYVLERGRVVAHGTHDELLAAGGTYARMWALQAGAPH